MAWIITIVASGLSSLLKLVACLSSSQEVVGSIPGLGNFSSATFGAHNTGIIYPTNIINVTRT